MAHLTILTILPKASYIDLMVWYRDQKGRQGCELIGRPEKVSIGDQLETTFEVKWRPFGYHFEDGWRPIIKLSVVSSNIDSNNFGLRKMALLYLNLASLSLIFNLYKVYKNQNYNLSNIKEYSIIAC